MNNRSPALERWIDQARAVPIESELARRGIKLNGKVERRSMSEMWRR